MASSVQKNKTIALRLYRSLLRASTPFSGSSARAVAAQCALLDRRGLTDPPWFTRTVPETIPDEDDDDDIGLLFSNGDAENFDNENDDDNDICRQWLERLLRQVVSGSSKIPRQMQFPHHLLPVSEDTDQQTKEKKDKNTNQLQTIIRQEFRGQGIVSSSPQVPDTVRRKLAFQALKLLNEKLNWYDELQQTSQQHTLPSVAMNVSMLPSQPPSSYLQRGAFLVAHPNLTGYFRRTVICLLQHSTTTDKEKGYATYGLVVNRTACHNNQSLHPITLAETYSSALPEELLEAFGNCPIRDGGPVPGSLQMMHVLSSKDDDDDDSDDQINRGEFLQGETLSIMPGNSENETIVDEPSPYEIRVRGDLRNAAALVTSGRLSLDHVAFFAGACTWGDRQLESEVERGVWLPCRAPPDLAFSSSSPLLGSSQSGIQEPEDLWASMLAACGEECAELAHLTWKDKGDHPYAIPCDALLD